MAYTKQTWANDPGGGTPLNANRLNYMETGIEDAHEGGDYGTHLITWNGSAWRYRGATVTVRPTTIPTYDDGAQVMWDTTQDVTVTTPPALAINGDLWRPHGSAVVSI